MPGPVKTSNRHGSAMQNIATVVLPFDNHGARVNSKYNHADSKVTYLPHHSLLSPLPSTPGKPSLAQSGNPRSSSIFLPHVTYESAVVKQVPKLFAAIKDAQVEA
ncbi:hypothetical protein SDJN02_16068, partial [Cucurbita argyrosperma subsp. argyrosperma]